jgi:uncharacterized protein YdaU (DUF1376 family)
MIHGFHGFFSYEAGRLDKERKEQEYAAQKALEAKRAAEAKLVSDIKRSDAIAEIELQDVGVIYSKKRCN